MALESGTRLVRMVGAEHWTDTPERELPTIAAGGDTYAVHERVCVDSARVRLVLAEGEDVAAALREVYGEAVRDVRVYRLVEAGTGVVEGLPEWRLTLPVMDDPAHDPLPGLIARLAGVAPIAPVCDAVEVADLDAGPAEVVTIAHLATEPEVDVPALLPLGAPDPVVEAAFEPLTAQHDDPFAVPAETVFPAEAIEADDVAVPAVQVETVVEPGTVVVADVPVAEAEPETVVVADVPVAGVEPEVADERVAEVAPEPEPEPAPDPRDLHFATVANVLELGRSTCVAVDRDGPCSTASDVVWQTAAGAAWACAWHWPSAMAGHPGAEVGAVRGAGSASWTTWRDGDSLTLARQAADLFADAAREHGSPVARPLVALDRLDEMLTSLPDDLRGAVLLWSISVTNPEWEVAAVVQHGRATHELNVAESRAVAYPDELYFQMEVVSAAISPTSLETAAPAGEVRPSGEALFARGTAFAAAGDRRAAAQAWAEAADGHNHALSMRALGDLSCDRDDLKTAEEWYGRAAMLNDTPSMNRIATILEGRGQADRAGEWLRRAARFGDEEAARRLQSAQSAVAASV